MTADSFTALLKALDPDRDRAGEKYEDQRRVLIRYFEWRGAASPDEHADEVLNRVSRKLAGGVEIKNLGGYCHEVARLIFLETTRSIDTRSQPLETIENEAAPEIHSPDSSIEQELRLECLQECLQKLPDEGAELVLEYYDYERGQIERRRQMAARLGLRREALANRVQRLRDKLENCVRTCQARKQAIRTDGL